MSQRRKIKISVRELAEAFPPTGSIDDRDRLLSDPVLGTEIHLAIQQSRREEMTSYRAEVPVAWTFQHKTWQIEVSGRVDGIYTADAITICEEIKSSYTPKRLLKKLQNDREHPYVLQAQLYAYLFALKEEKDLGSVVPRLLVVSAHERSAESLDCPIEQAAIENWLELRIVQIIKREKLRRKFVEQRQKMADELQFPFAEARQGQLELIDVVAKHIGNRGRVMIQAPTGLGKSVGVLYPALRDSLRRGSKVLYTTPRNSQHTVAENACNLWRKSGVDLRVLTLTARSKLCFKEEQKCNPDYCEFARGHFDKVNEHKLVSKVCKKSQIDSELLIKIGKQFEVCPYELGMQCLPDVDVVIGDYNYAFSPAGSIVERCFAGVLEKPKMNLVIDEAHNLYARAMEYFSPRLSDSIVELARAELVSLDEKQRQQCESVLLELKDYIDQYCNEYGSKPRVIQPATQPLMEILGQITKFLGQAVDRSDRGESAEFSDGLHPLMPIQWAVANFFEIALLQEQGKGEEFFCIGELLDGIPSLQFHCCNASAFLAERYKAFNSTVAFSATLKPFSFYARVTGIVEDTQPESLNIHCVEFASPFAAENRKIMVIPQVSTTYEDRSQHYGRITEIIARVVSLKMGNYFVFFPSFDFLKKVSENVRSQLNDYEVVEQVPGTSSSDARRLLKMFSRQSNLVVLGVQGGVFAEGIDLPGDQLIGAIIVGPAVPPFNFIREQIKRYYDKKYGSGFDFAYTFPAMSRVVQAAGRVIRTESDRGIILLLDRRFLLPQYVSAMPVDWLRDGKIESLVSSSILSDVTNFWQNAKPDGSSSEHQSATPCR